jgi:DNA-directed RNA polymerase specialized sigma24 family protein
MTIALEQEVFDKLYREFHPRVLAICRQMLGSLEQAEEAANDVFARLPIAMRSALDFEGGDKLLR